MKFFPIVLLLLLMSDGLKGLTLPQESPDQGLNTTLLANFSGLYVRRNPCSNEELETSSYEASHEFHHCNKEPNWTDLTDKCSALISSFLKSVCNLVKFNDKRDGTLTLNVNTSISQNHADQHNCKDGKYSLPTIVIKATNYEDTDQSEKWKEKGLTGEESKQEGVNGVFGKQKILLGELSAISQESSTSNTFGKETEADLLPEIPGRPVKTFKRTHAAKPEHFSPLPSPNARNFEARQESENAFKQSRNKYVTERPGSTTPNAKEEIMPQTEEIARSTLSSPEKWKLHSGGQYRNSKFEIKPTGSFETVPNREKFSPVNQSQLPSNSVRAKTSDFVLPASSVTQQPTTPLFSRVQMLPHNDNSNLPLTTISPINSIQKQETVEEITEFSEKSESLIAGNAPQAVSLNSDNNPTTRPIQPAEPLDYLTKQAEISTPNIPVSSTDLREYLPTTDQFEQGNVPTELPYGKKQPQILKQHDILPYTPSTSEASPGTSSVGLTPQTHFDATQPRPKNLFQQSLNYPVSEKINQASSYSQSETRLTSSEEQTELYRDGQYYTTLPPKSVEPDYVTPPAFSVDEFSSQKAGTDGAFEIPSQKPLSSKINEKAGNVYNTQPGLNPSHTRYLHQKTTPVKPAESLIRAKQEANEATKQGPLPSPTTQYKEEVTDRFQSSEQSDSTYAQISETILDNNQNVPGSPFYDKMENRSPREHLKSKAILDKESTQPLDYLLSTPQPMPSSYDKKSIKNVTGRPERQVAGRHENFSEQAKSSKNRTIVTEPTTDAFPVTYGPKRKVTSSLEKEIEITESSLMQASQTKPDFHSSQIPNYASPTPPQDNSFASDSSFTSATVEYDRSDSLSTASSSSSSRPIVSESKSQIIPEEPPRDYYDIPSKQPSNNRNNAAHPLNKLLDDSPTTSYSGVESKMTATDYESVTTFSQQNQQLVPPFTEVYESQTISTPRPVEMINPVKFQPKAKNSHTSKNYYDQSSTPKTAVRENKKNFDSSATSHPPSALEVGDVSVKPTKLSDDQLPVGPLPLTFTPEDFFPERAVKTTESMNSSAESKSFTLEPLDYGPSLPELRRPLGTSTNTPGRNQLPADIQPQSQTTEQFSETATDSSDAYSHQISSTIVPISASQNVEANATYKNRQDSLLTAASKTEKASASEESYYFNENSADSFSEESQYDDIASSQDAKTQIPQPQPSFDYSEYSGQLSGNERESNTASTDLQTSKTFEGSKPNIQSLLTYSPLPSVPAKTQTFTTEIYESDDIPNDYSDEPKPTGRAETSSPSPARNIETIDITEVSEVYSGPTYDGGFVPTTPSPPLTAIEAPVFVKTGLPATEKYSVTETFIQDISTTPRPRSVNSVQYDQEIITIDSQPTPSPSPVAVLPVKNSGQFLNKKKEQGFAGGSLAATERFDDKMTTSEAVLKNTNRHSRNERVAQTFNSNLDIEKKHSPKRLPAQGVTISLHKNDTKNSPKTETVPNNSGSASSSVHPVHTKTTLDEEVIATDSSNFMSSSHTQASPKDRPQRLSNKQFDSQRRHFSGPATSHFSRQFYPENRALYHPRQGFPSPRQFENPPHGNYPHPMDFNPQAPRPRFRNFDEFPREQHNQYPASFQHNQFEPHFPDQFHPGSDTQRDRFMFSAHPSSYGNRYFPDGRPNFHYNQPPRSNMNSESFSSPHVPPNYHSFQHPDAFEEGDFQHRSHQEEESLAQGNFNTHLTAPHYAPSYEPYSYGPRDAFNQRLVPGHQSFGPEPRGSFHPDHIPYNQMMQPYGNHPAGHFSPHSQLFLNNSNQQVEDRYRPHNFDHSASSIHEAKAQVTQKTDIKQASSEVLDDYKEALTGLASGERLVEFDEEVITISPEKGSNLETTVVTEEHEQRQDEASYGLRNQGLQKTRSLHESSNTTASGEMHDVSHRSTPHEARQGNAFRAQNLPSSSSQNRPMPFPHSVDPFGPQRPHALPNSSDQFRRASSNFHHPSSANFANPHVHDGGSVVGSNPSQSDSHAASPHQSFPPSKPDPTSSRRPNAPSPYRNPVARPPTAP